MSYEQILDWILDEARVQGAKYPAIAEATDQSPVIVDDDSGRMWKIKLEEF